MFNDEDIKNHLFIHSSNTALPFTELGPGNTVIRGKKKHETVWDHLDYADIGENKAQDQEFQRYSTCGSKRRKKMKTKCKVL